VEDLLQQVEIQTSNSNPNESFSISWGLIKSTGLFQNRTSKQIFHKYRYLTHMTDKMQQKDTLRKQIMDDLQLEDQLVTKEDVNLESSVKWTSDQVTF
jgi:hypothetical protein